MSDVDDIDEIRENRRRELESQLERADDSGGQATPDEPVHVHGSAEFQSVVDDHDIVLVDFYADWCGPCKMLEPIVERVAADTSAAVAKVDVDANQGLAAEYGVRGVPTMVLFSDGAVAERIVGVRDADALSRLVEQAAN